jgi:RNA polymerase sigma factor (sigma-70 family)
MNAMIEDAELLRRYVEENAEDAFAELVRRHVNLVYSAALRQLNGDVHFAADATQLVFTDLARKAAALCQHRVLAGWLFTSTRFATAKLVRTERRRQAREQEAHLMQELTHDNPAEQLDWQRVRPVLDDVIGELKEQDREAILLRFFEGQDYAAVGARLHLNDNTARMRVERALDKMRALLVRRGVNSTTAALAAALGSQAVMAAPTGLAASVTGAALAGGVAIAGAATGGTLAAAGTFMSVTKLQIGLASAVVAAGTAGFVMQADASSALRDELDALREHSRQVAELESDTVRLARTAAEIADLRIDGARVVQLRQDVAVLERDLQARMAKPARTRASRTYSGVPRTLIEGPVFDIVKLDQTPKPKFQAPPIYPADLRKSEVGGTVVVDFVVNDKGEVQNAFALRSTQREFEASAIEAVSRWKFEPGQKEGLPVNARMQMPIVYTLEKPSDSATQAREKPKSGGFVPWF